MSQVSVSDLLASLETARRNPSAIQRLAVQTVESVMDGTIDIVDPTSPFVLMMELGACMTATAINHNTALNRRQYSKLAQSLDDIYLHMSDKDFAGRFGTPARTTLMFVFKKDEIYQRAVTSEVESIKKLTIPRHTAVSVAGYTFTMQYPIDIRIMAHGGLQITYDSTKLSPLETLSTNVLAWRTVKIESEDYIVIDVPMQQFAIETNYGSLNSVTSFSQKYDFENSFYYARVYNVEDNGSFTEISTTHSDQVYDADVPTALLTVLDQQLKVEIPQIYFTNKLLTNQIRIDIYTTNGSIEMSLSDYPASAFTATWVDIDDAASVKYWTPLKVFNTMWISADANVTGGAGALALDTLRTRVIENANGESDIPITPVQVKNKLNLLSYDIVKSHDTLTERSYLATRALPSPSDGSVASGAGAAINTVETSFTKLAVLDSVANNGNRLTIKPDTLYQDVSGIITVVDSTTVNSIKGLELEARVSTINSGKYLYSPFHYVLDTNDDAFDSRAYYLDAPKITTKEYIGSNTTIAFDVSTDAYYVAKTDTGYRILLKVTSDATFKALSDDAIFVQASFTPPGETDKAYMLGEYYGLSDGERVFEFNITTNWDITASDYLLLTSFKMYGDDVTRNTPIELDCSIDFIYGVIDYTQDGLKVSSLDTELADFLYTGTPTGVIQERLNFDLGSALTGLWTNSRSVASSIEYRKYTQDVYWTWESDVYETDETGTIKLTMVDGVPTANKLHSAGDQILTNGQPTIRYLAGSTMMVDGAPVPVNVRSMLRQIDIFMIDGLYYFATSEASTNYKATIPSTIVDWVESDIATIDKKLLEKTDLFFYPKRTIGDIDVIIGENVETTIKSTQSFNLTFYMSAAGYANSDLRTQIETTAISTIAAGLEGATVAMDEIISNIRAKVGSDVIAFSLTGLGGDKQLTAITLKDTSGRCTIAKKIVVDADNTLLVKDDINIDFIKHSA